MHDMASPVTERLASNIRAELARRQISQATMGRHLGMAQPSLSRRLTGRVPFAADELVAIAAYLHVSLDSLTVAA